MDVKEQVFKRDETSLAVLSSKLVHIGSMLAMVSRISFARGATHDRVCFSLVALMLHTSPCMLSLASQCGPVNLVTARFLVVCRVQGMGHVVGLRQAV